MVKLKDMAAFMTSFSAAGAARRPLLVLLALAAAACGAIVTRFAAALANFFTGAGQRVALLIARRRGTPGRPRRGVVAVALAMTLGLAGCLNASNRAYSIDGHTFHGFDNAAAYMRAKNEEQLANVQPLPAPIAGPALVVVPTRAQIVRTLGLAPPYWDEHEIRQLVELYSYLYRSVERRNIFQSVQDIEAENPEGTQVPAQGYLIWYELRPFGAGDIGTFAHMIASGEAQRTMIFDAMQFAEEEWPTRVVHEIEKYVKAHPAAE